jgi:hypothetical protein
MAYAAKGPGSVSLKKHFRSIVRLNPQFVTVMANFMPQISLGWTAVQA